MKDGDYIRPINKHIHILKNDDKTGYVSSEKERFDLWCDENEIKPHYLNFIFDK